MAGLQRSASSPRLIPGPSRRGFTLAEVMVAILLTAIVTVSVFSVALTARRAPLKYDLRSAARAQQAMLLDQLKNYVTADRLAAWGPNSGAWTFPGDSCGGCVYALATGGVVHDVTSRLPARLQGAPYNMTMTYTVTNVGPGASQAQFRPRVDVNIQWTEPQ